MPSKCATKGCRRKVVRLKHCEPCVQAVLARQRAEPKRHWRQWPQERDAAVVEHGEMLIMNGDRNHEITSEEIECR